MPTADLVYDCCTDSIFGSDEVILKSEIYFDMFECTRV